MLVDERKIRWDDPVTQHMPGFQMYDPYVTREMTIRDLLTHRSGLGLGAGDLMFFPPGDLGRDEIIKRLRFIKPATSFRSAYAYDNLLYIAAGQLIPAVTGQELGRFRPRTHLHAARHDEHLHRRRGAAQGQGRGDSAQRALRQAGSAAAGRHGHQRAGGRHHHLRGRPGEVDDRAAQRRRTGREGKTRLFSAAQSRQMWSAQTILPIGEPAKDAPAAFVATQPNFHAYGLGWDLRDYRGKRLVGHTGKPGGLCFAHRADSGIEARHRGSHQPGGRRPRIPPSPTR